MYHLKYCLDPCSTVCISFCYLGNVCDNSQPSSGHYPPPGQLFCKEYIHCGEIWDHKSANLHNIAIPNNSQLPELIGNIFLRKSKFNLILFILLVNDFCFVYIILLIMTVNMVYGRIRMHFVCLKY